MTNRVLVTGAGGFIGQFVCRELMQQDVPVTAVVRKIKEGALAGDSILKWIEIDLCDDFDENSLFADVDSVIYLAARVHIMHESKSGSLDRFRKVNTSAVLGFARAAAANGVRRFVFLSSIKVNGEFTVDEPWSEASAESPQDNYALSKWEAEQGLHAIAAETGMEVTIIRPPLVYGPGVRANFLKLLRWVKQGLPLPLASIRNRRSMIYVENLADAIIKASRHPMAAGKTYLISDGEDLSTPDMIREIGLAVDKPALLLPFPAMFLRFAGLVLNKSEEMSRLTSSLQVDSSLIRKELDWTPPYTLKQGIRKTADWYKETC